MPQTVSSSAAVRLRPVVNDLALDENGQPSNVVKQICLQNQSASTRLRLCRWWVTSERSL